MNADSYYEIGNGHKVCEDYAVSGVYKNLVYAIISDGCSGSNNTDVGARILSIIARDTLLYLYNRDILFDFSKSIERYSIFKELILKKCLEAKSTLNLSVNTFDATLLIAFSNGNTSSIMAWGDGYIIIEKQGGVIINELKFESGAPYYLSYNLDDNKNKIYLDTYKSTLLIHNVFTLNNDKIPIVIEKPCDIDIPFEKVYNVEDNILRIILSSDGIDTYFDDKNWIDPEKGENKNYTAIDIIPRIIGYKSTIGEFVTRRMSRLKKDMKKDHILHDDDISCSAININE